MYQACRDKVTYYTQIENLVRQDQKLSVMDSNDILDSDKFLRDFVRMYLDKDSGLQQSLILCLMRAFISKANGHKNSQYGPKAKNFLLALAATDKRASELVSANLNLAGERNIHRLAAEERAAPIILNKEEEETKPNQMRTRTANMTWSNHQKGLIHLNVSLTMEMAMQL